MTGLVTTAEAARAIGRAPQTIRDWVRAGHLTAYGTGHRRTYALRQVVAVDQRIRSRKVAGHHDRLRRTLDTLGQDTPADLLDDILDRPHDYAISVVTTDPAEVPDRAAG